MHLAIPSSQRSSRAHCAHRLMGAVLLAGLAVVLAAPVGAVPARPGLYTLRSPDGQVFQASLHGDEWHHWWQTPDGRIIEQDPAGRYVMKGAGRPMMSPQQAARRASARRGPQRAVPATGTGRIPVLCGNFSDTSTTYNPGDYQTLLFTGPQSMSAFYSENSYDQFTVDAGPEGVSGWYDVSNTHDYYGTNVAGNDEHPAEFVIEVVEAADAAGFDFGPYDTDNDGYVDVVCIAHQGTDEAAGGPSTDIWSHSWDLNSASFFGDGTGEVTTSSGKKVNAYIIQPELQPNNDLVTIGVYCHEYGHALGLPDFYDYTGMSQGLGDWSLMAGGGWGGGDGSMPSHMDAWCKITLGWVTPIEPTTSVFGAQLPMAEQNPVMYKVTSLAADTEYYLIENRQQTGFDAALPGEGVLIYHVDDTRTSNDNTWYPGWTSFGHYWVALEQADGLWQLERFWAASPPGNSGDTGDPYPGTTGNRSYDNLSTPSATTYANVGFPLVVRNISTSGDVMTLDIVDTQAPLAPASITAADTPGDNGGSVTVGWSRSGDDGRGANDVVGYDVQRAGDAAGPFTTVATQPAGTTAYLDTDVTDGLSYWYKVVCEDSAGLTSETKVGGPAIPRNDSSPPAIDNLVAQDTQADNGRSITLSWVGYASVSDLARFRVYRGPAAFTSITEDGVEFLGEIASAGARSYIDKAQDPDADPTEPEALPLDQTDYWYAVTALDIVGNAITTVTPTGPVQCAPNLSLSYSYNLRMITVPADPIEPGPMDVFGFTDPTTESFARYDPATQAYHTIATAPDDPFLTIVPGRAYWLDRDVPSFIGVGGRLVDEAETAVPLGQGWNQVGSPYDADYLFEGILVRDQLGTDTPITASNLVRKYGWRYDGFARSYRLLSPVLTGAEPTLPRREGMWIYATAPGLSLVFQNNVGVVGETVAAEREPLDGWQLQLIASTADGADLDNYLGATGQAEALGAIVSPPPVGSGVDLYFTNRGAERLAADLRKSVGPQAKWAVTVECGPADADVELMWPDMMGVPPTVRPILTDLATGRSVYMRTAASYTYRSREAGERRKFEIACAGAEAPLVIGQLAATPVRSGGLELTYALPRAADVTIEVRNVAGRVVTTLPTAGGQPGLNRVLWNGQSAGGQGVPNGRYLVVVKAAAQDNGETAQAVRAITLDR